MIDPLDALIGGTAGLGLGSAVMGLFRASAGRNLSALDDTLKALKVSIDELGRDIRALRETDIAQAKDIGALQEASKTLNARLDGQALFYREQLEEHRKLVHDRLTDANRNMLEAARGTRKK